MGIQREPGCQPSKAGRLRSDLITMRSSAGFHSNASGARDKEQELEVLVINQEALTYQHI